MKRFVAAILLLLLVAGCAPRQIKPVDQVEIDRAVAGATGR